jgi:hypothetical protein
LNQLPLPISSHQFFSMKAMKKQQLMEAKRSI